MFKTVLGGLTAIGLALSISAANAADYRLGLITPPPHKWTKTAEQAAAEIKERTGGRIDITIFPSGQLGNEAQMLQQLQTGALDFAFMTIGEFANRDPNYGVFLAPYIADDVAEAQTLLKGETAKNLIHRMRKFGLKGFGYGMAGLRQIVVSGDAKTVADLSGKKIRTVPLAPEFDFWSRLGAAPTPMPLPSLYDAFANGQVDGMQIDFELTWNVKYYEHAGTIIESNHMMFPMVAVASMRNWANIPAEDQAAIEEVLLTQLDGLVGSYADIDADYLAKLKGTDVPVIKVDRSFFGDAVDNWYEAWRERAPLLKQLEDEAAKL